MISRTFNRLGPARSRVAWALLASVWAASFATPAARAERVVSFVMENDIVSGEDRDYTNGLRFSALGLNARQAGISGFIARRGLGAASDDDVYAGVAVNHAIFTPATYGASVAPPDQHPYAGMLTVDLETHRVGPIVMERASLQAGLVGPAAGGAEVQIAWHDFTASEEPRGWDAQLRDEPLLGVAYERAARSIVPPRFGRGFEMLTNAGVSVGNALAEAHLGANLRYGDDLQNDFGPPRVRSGFGGGDVFNPVDNRSWYLFAGAQARGVARNIVLDGNTFLDGGPQVTREPFVHETSAGLVYQAGATRTALVVVKRSREFAEQPRGQTFGALSVSQRL